ncbi:terminase [Gracilibacillus dipsosauri]|uniref:Terminase n=2 Tax=Gracilibacillus dipsosauri TaxID=178340 RepID=A0A317L1C5_9BACI|nr:terminase [Gracilibacillus dipsosauri]
MSKVDTSSPVEVEKVGRYLKHIEIYRRMEKKVKAEGVSITVRNGSQSYVKSHPLLAEMNKVNASIINIERSFRFQGDDENKNSYSANDLL